MVFYWYIFFLYSTMGSINIDPLTPAQKCGKSPHWDFRTQCLYWVDGVEGTVHCYKPDCDRYTTATIGCGKISTCLLCLCIRKLKSCEKLKVIWIIYF